MATSTAIVNNFVRFHATFVRDAAAFHRSTPHQVIMKSTARKWLCLSALGLGMALATVGAARAGAVSLNFDPAFGPGLPNVDYEGGFKFTVPDACVGNSSGFVLLATCGGAVDGTGTLTLSKAGASVTAPISLDVLGLFLTKGFVTGWVTDSTPLLTQFYGLTGKDFFFGFLDLPELAFVPCPGWQTGCVSSLTGFDGTVYYANAAGNSPLGKDSQGNNIGYNITVGASGTAVLTPTSQAVPEPGSLALAAVALLGLAVTAKRRGRQEPTSNG